MMRFTYLLDVMLEDEASPKYFNIDGHPPTVR